MDGSRSVPGIRHPNVKMRILPREKAGTGFFASCKSQRWLGYRINKPKKKNAPPSFKRAKGIKEHQQCLTMEQFDTAGDI